MSYNYKTLVHVVSERTNLPCTVCDKIIRTSLEEILYAVDKDEKVSIRGFGVFSMQVRKGRTIKVVGSQEERKIPHRRCLSFKPAKWLKQVEE